MAHHTKDKGDLATIKAIADLTQKGFVIFIPVVCEHLPFDFIGFRDGKLIKFQSKYRKTGSLCSKTIWTDKHGVHRNKYASTDFDYYAIYLPDKDVVCYAAISFAGATIATTVRNSPTPFYWYEDFLDLTDHADKKTYHDFNFEITRASTSREKSSTSREKYRKVVRPSKEELTKLIWSKPMSNLAIDFGVSDKAISKWAKSYGIALPGRGYWSTQAKLER